MSAESADWELIVFTGVIFCIAVYVVVVTKIQRRRSRELLAILLKQYPRLFARLPKGFKWFAPLVAIRYLRWKNILPDESFRNAYRTVESLSWHLAGAYALLFFSLLLAIYGVRVLGWRW